jgi:hypothetical protein
MAIKNVDIDGQVVQIDVPDDATDEEIIRAVQSSPLPAPQPQTTAAALEAQPVQAGITRGAGALEPGEAAGEPFRQRALEDLLSIPQGIAGVAQDPVGFAQALGNIGLGTARQAAEAIAPETAAMPIRPEVAAGQRAAQQIGGELTQLATDPLEAISERPVTAPLDILTILAGVPGASSALAKVPLVGGLTTAPRRGVAAVAERLTTAPIKRSAGDLGLNSSRAFEIINRKSPDLSKSVTGELTDIDLVNRGQQAVQAARQSLGERFRQAIGPERLASEVNLNIPKTRLDQKLNEIGFSRVRESGRLKVDKLTSGLTRDDANLIKNWVESNFDSVHTSSPVATLNDVDSSIRQAMRDNVPKGLSKQGNKVAEIIQRRVNEGIDVQVPGYLSAVKAVAPDFDRLRKATEELSLKPGARESTTASALINSMKKGEDLKLKAVDTIEEFSGLDLKDMATGQAIRRNLGKTAKTPEGLIDKVKQRFGDIFTPTERQVAEGIAREGVGEGGIMNALRRAAIATQKPVRGVPELGLGQLGRIQSTIEENRQ